MTKGLDSPFVADTQIQFAWDSTSLTTAMACPLRYRLEVIEGWQPKDPNVAVALVFGILLHAGIEAYHKAQAEGLKYADSVHKALRHVTEKDDFRQPGVPILDTLPVDSDIEEMVETQDEDEEVWTLRNSRIRTKYHLFRALVWYFETYRHDRLEVLSLDDGRPAVEHSFRVPVGETLSDGTPILLSGHYDKLCTLNGDLFVTDVKTTKSITSQWRRSFDLSHQMTGYILGGKIGFEQNVHGAMIDAVCLQVGGVKFQRFNTTRTESQLQEYVQLLKYVADQAEMWYQNNYYPQNTSACMFCQYKDVCSQPPEFRGRYLHTYFEQKEAWNPLANR